MATNPIRIGIVGIGRAGWSMHCSELAGREDKFQIVAACDILEERRQMMADRYGCAVYERLADLLADPNVELVDICTRSCDHYAHVKQALASGKHVQDEKPITLTWDEAKDLRATAATSKGNLYIRHNRRYETEFNHIREIMASGILGEIYEIKLRRVSYGFRADWQAMMEYGGGQLLNWGPHLIDHSLRLLESPLNALWSDLKLIAAAGDAEDHLKIIFTGENGRIVDLEISGGAAISEPEYLIWGTNGALSCTGNMITLKYLDPDNLPEKPALDPGPPFPGYPPGTPLPWIEKTFPAEPAKPATMDIIWDDLYLAIREGAPYPITLDEAVGVMEVITKVKAGTPFDMVPASS